MSLNHERVQPILRVDGLNVELKIRNKQKKLVENVSFEVEPGQCLGILGESGSGKSMTVKAILGLLDRQFRIEGQAWFEGKDLCRAGRDELRRLRGQKIGMVLQNPMTCFDPLYRIGSQMAETFAAHTDWDRAKIREISLEVLEKMRIHNPEEVLGQYPHQLSGGMLQRIMIGLALAMKPALLVADEHRYGQISIPAHFADGILSIFPVFSADLPVIHSGSRSGHPGSAAYRSWSPV